MRIAIASATIGLAIVAVSAEEGRYQVEPSVDGFIRLDTETGAVSHCSRRDGVWQCDVLAADGDVIEAIASDVEALGKRLDALAARVDEIEASGTVIAPEDAGSSFAETLVDRLFQLVRDVKRQQQNS